MASEAAQGRSHCNFVGDNLLIKETIREEEDVEKDKDYNETFLLYLG